MLPTTLNDNGAGFDNCGAWTCAVDERFGGTATGPRCWTDVVMDRRWCMLNRLVPDSAHSATYDCRPAVVVCYDVRTGRERAALARLMPNHRAAYHNLFLPLYPL